MIEDNLQIFSGFGFDENGPYLIIDVPGNKITNRKEIPIIGKQFTIRVLDQKYCIGRYDLKTFDSFPCPNRRKLLNSKDNICFDCFKFNGFNPSFYNVSSDQLSAKQKEYNLEAHNVYLAFFSKSHIKVGISHHSRNLTRWLEQGARIATVIYKCKNANEASELEQRISNEIKLSQAFRADQKRQLLKNELVLNEAVECLDKLRDQIELAISVRTITTEYHRLDGNYLLGNIIQKNIIDVSSELPIMASGTGVGLVGETLLFENSKQQFMVSLKKIIGHQISFDNTLSKQAFTPLQPSLF